MHDDDLRAYVDEIQHQRNLVELAVHILDDALQALPDSSVGCFAASQMILTGAAQISKLLWADTSASWTPERTAFAVNRAASLRAIVKPDPILQGRAVRNAIEHYDSRLDDITLDSSVREEGTHQGPWSPDDRPKKITAVVDISVSKRSEFPLPVPPENIIWMRHIDHETLEYTALDRSISISAVVDAIRDVSARAAEWLAARPIPDYTPGELGDLSEYGL
ncbi:hypothetical protein [Microbacterium sp. Root553]|uniref:hypothetical protein n=1 Tax=Microbacterium sp. Root553 TaxID=1736556 RepID=UPI0007020541|nr:hypothetical protein [Microbacterium sp. Root553]KQZ22314.1 hypothetical protein ASD43_16510 [Microbacterium sp. Root553]